MFGEEQENGGLVHARNWERWRPAGIFLAATTLNHEQLYSRLIGWEVKRKVLPVLNLRVRASVRCSVFGVQGFATGVFFRF